MYCPVNVHFLYVEKSSSEDGHTDIHSLPDISAPKSKAEKDKRGRKEKEREKRKREEKRERERKESKALDKRDGEREER